VIVASVGLVMIESVDRLRTAWGGWLRAGEWAITALFTVEYVLRLLSAPRPVAYARSFFGVVDLVAILPTFVSLLLPGTQSLLVVRALRLLRIFRVFKAARYLLEENLLRAALASSVPKVVVFLGTVLVLVVITGSAMYLIEGAENGFTSIPRSMYWAIVTMTTVGYGDIAPQTVSGQLLAVLVMLLGYSIIAVPTGIVSAELVRGAERRPAARTCPFCMSEGHEFGARYCKDCGARLPPR
jgi:voltage-gated potassium channel